MLQFWSKREPDVLDLEWERIECHQDELELTKVLIGKIKSSLERLVHNELGHGAFVVANSTEGDITKFKFHSNHNNI